jgi:hypothetical protein
MQFKPFWLGISLCFFFACTNKPKDPIEGQQIKSIRVQRFDAAFFAIDTNHVSAGIASLHKNYPNFSSDFFNRLLQVDPINDTLKIKKIFKELSPVYARALVINTPQQINTDLNKALTRFHFYFPDYTLPENLVYYISPMESYSNVIGANYIGVGLQVSIFDHYAKEQISFHTIQNLSIDYLSNTQQEKGLLYQMIESGKRQFILNTICLNTPDTLLWDYSAIQLKALKEQESEIWQYLKEQQMLMSNERIDFLNILGDAATNSLLGAPLPGNIGKYIGYRIVESYMNKQPRIPWKNLQKLAKTSPSEIYAAANYQP